MNVKKSDNSCHSLFLYDTFYARFFQKAFKVIQKKIFICSDTKITGFQNVSKCFLDIQTNFKVGQLVLFK